MTQNDASIQEARRAAFEAWAAQRRYPLQRDGVVVCYAARCTDEAWDAWNAALDSVEVKLPEVEYFGDYWSGGYAIKKEDVAEAIQAAGIKVKP